MAAVGSFRNTSSEPQFSALSQRNLSPPLKPKNALCVFVCVCVCVCVCVKSSFVPSNGAGECTFRANNDWMVVEG